MHRLSSFRQDWPQQGLFYAPGLPKPCARPGIVALSSAVLACPVQAPEDTKVARRKAKADRIGTMLLLCKQSADLDRHFGRSRQRGLPPLRVLLRLQPALVPEDMRAAVKDAQLKVLMQHGSQLRYLPDHESVKHVRVRARRPALTACLCACT